ncbi:hypothetical protein ACFYTG_47365 [Streptomyces mirabilis]|uniref:hypothetical protein n=1 Tax=Streptomyces mirabilis TaxID=68239 RepID=UPI0036A51D58
MPLSKITASGRCGNFALAATDGRQSLAGHVFPQTLFTQGPRQPHRARAALSSRAINETPKKRAAAAKVKYVNGLKVTSCSLRAGSNTDTKCAKVPLTEPREVGDWGEKSVLPDSRYNQPGDTVDATETDPLDTVPLFGRFKEPSEVT